MIFDMDRVILHVDGHQRHFPGPPAVAQIGYFARKDHRVRRPFATWNISFILAGAGTYAHEGRLHRVNGPAVLTQWPGAPMDYGPESAGWEELYLIYPHEAGPALARAGLWPGRSWWPVADPRRFRRAVDDLRDLLLGPVPSVDRLDRLAELAVMEALLGAEEAPPDGLEEAVRAIQAEVDSRWREDLDFPRLAHRQGISYSHFRRCWLRRLGLPPMRYLTELRLHHAARSLVVGEVPISTIAQEVGFPDPLHFSRRFRAVMGLSPTAYRERYRVGRMPGSDTDPT